MKWVKRILLGVVSLVVVLAAVGLVLPAKFRLERSVTIAAPAGKVYPLIAAPAQWTRWSVWTQRDPKMQIEYSGPAAGVGARWTWRSETEGNGTMEFTDALPGEKLTYRLSFPDMGMQSTGQLRIEPQGTGVRVSWSNEGEMGANPLNRWFGLFMDRLVGPDFEDGLKNLKALVEG